MLFTYSCICKFPSEMGIILFQKVGGGWDLNFDVKYGIDAWFISCNKNTYCRLLVRKNTDIFCWFIVGKNIFCFYREGCCSAAKPSPASLYTRRKKRENRLFIFNTWLCNLVVTSFWKKLFVPAKIQVFDLATKILSKCLSGKSFF